MAIESEITKAGHEWFRPVAPSELMCECVEINKDGAVFKPVWEKTDAEQFAESLEPRYHVEDRVLDANGHNIYLRISDEAEFGIEGKHDEGGWIQCHSVESAERILAFIKAELESKELA